MTKKSPKSPSDVPENETKDAKFLRVVTPRITKVVKAIRVIGNCFGTGYTYTPEQATQIISALTAEINTLEAVASKVKTSTPDFSWK
jgi:hypothetical protein